MNNSEDILNILLSAMNNGSNDENSSNNENEQSDSNINSIFDGIDLNMIMAIGEIMSKMNESDKNTDLLLALKPHLREENRAKIDTAIKLFRLISLLPYLKDSGLLNNLF